MHVYNENADKTVTINLFFNISWKYKRAMYL